MANISNNITNVNTSKISILNSQYGSQVRTSIAAAIENLLNAIVSVNTSGTENQSGSTVEDLSITTNKLAHGAVTEQKLSSEVKDKLISYVFNDMGAPKVTLTIGDEAAILEISETGGIKFLTENADTVQIQSRVAILINDNSATVDLNDFYPLHETVDIVAPNLEDIQLSNFPGTQEEQDWYAGAGFIFSRTYSHETFMSYFDHILWARHKYGDTYTQWFQITPGISNTVG